MLTAHGWKDGCCADDVVWRGEVEKEAPAPASTRVQSLKLLAFDAGPAWGVMTPESGRKKTGRHEPCDMSIRAEQNSLGIITPFLAKGHEQVLLSCGLNRN